MLFNTLNSAINKNALKHASQKYLNEPLPAYDDKKEALKFIRNNVKDAHAKFSDDEIFNLIEELAFDLESYRYENSLDIQKLAIRDNPLCAGGKPAKQIEFWTHNFIFTANINTKQKLSSAERMASSIGQELIRYDQPIDKYYPSVDFILDVVSLSERDDLPEKFYVTLTPEFQSQIFHLSSLLMGCNAESFTMRSDIGEYATNFHLNEISTRLQVHEIDLTEEVLQEHREVLMDQTKVIINKESISFEGYFDGSDPKSKCFTHRLYLNEILDAQHKAKQK